MVNSREGTVVSGSPKFYQFHPLWPQNAPQAGLSGWRGAQGGRGPLRARPVARRARQHLCVAWWYRQGWDGMGHGILEGDLYVTANYMENGCFNGVSWWFYGIVWDLPSGND